jgi:oxygen-independent coproporphyrinogen III oxidase
MMEKKLGIYVHVPFCGKKCHYCDFNSYDNKFTLVAPYFQALYKEIERLSKNATVGEVQTIYVGGGTPSSVNPSFLKNTLHLLKKNFRVSQDVEVSIEVNPGTVTQEKLLAYKEYGFNRLSMGLQAVQKSLLQKIGRVHDFEDFLAGFQMARKAGFQNISVDLIFGLPGQTLEDWHTSLQEVVKCSPEHIACYSLKIEEKTLFGKLYRENKIDYLEDSLEREMYYFCNEYLKQEGYWHYEISNYAKEGRMSRHNNHYWACGEYLGFGAGAHSYLDGLRYANISTLEDYIKKVEEEKPLRDHQEEIDLEEGMKEYMILGLRRLAGISLNQFRETFHVDFTEVYGDSVKKLMDEGLLIREEDILRLSPTGLDLANKVFVEFV